MNLASLSAKTGVGLGTVPKPHCQIFLQICQHPQVEHNAVFVLQNYLGTNVNPGGTGCNNKWKERRLEKSELEDRSGGVGVAGMDEEHVGVGDRHHLAPVANREQVRQEIPATANPVNASQPEESGAGHVPVVDRFGYGLRRVGSKLNFEGQGTQQAVEVLPQIHACCGRGGKDLHEAVGKGSLPVVGKVSGQKVLGAGKEDRGTVSSRGERGPWT